MFPKWKAHVLTEEDIRRKRDCRKHLLIKSLPCVLPVMWLLFLVHRGFYWFSQCVSWNQNTTRMWITKGWGGIHQLETGLSKKLKCLLPTLLALFVTAIASCFLYQLVQYNQPTKNINKSRNFQKKQKIDGNELDCQELKLISGLYWSITTQTAQSSTAAEHNSTEQEQCLQVFKRCGALQKPMQPIRLHLYKMSSHNDHDNCCMNSKHAAPHWELTDPRRVSVLRFPTTTKHFHWSQTSSLRFWVCIPFMLVQINIVCFFSYYAKVKATQIRALLF